MHDDCVVLEPKSRKRKYRIVDRRKGGFKPKRWTVLLSYEPICGDCAMRRGDIESPLAGSGPGGHKPSFKSTKLARRARSFKDDFLVKIYQMRSPTNQGLRSQSPKGSRPKDTIDGGGGVGGGGGVYKDKGPMHEFDVLSKQIQVTLKHLKDVVAKRKLEMLPGNGTIVLDTVWAINLVVKSSVAVDQGSVIRSATHRMYQSVARLIKLCDDALIDSKSSSLEASNVDEVIALVEEAVQNLIKLSQDKISQQNNVPLYKTTPRSSYSNVNLDLPSQRNSLPDIPLTPREREILEQTSCTPGKVRSSHSSESILRDSSPPPPKPPLPDGALFNRPEKNVTPPPLPPKKKPARNLDDSDLNIYGLERISLRSKSPEDSSSLLSASAGSLDSVLNQSREEEEISALMDHTVDTDTLILDNDLSDIIALNGNSWGDLSHGGNHHENATISIFNHSNELQTNYLQHNHRLSNTDSGIVSMHSQRNSSCSKRSSQQSSVSQWCGTSVVSQTVKTSKVSTKSESIFASSANQIVSSSASNHHHHQHRLMLKDEMDLGLGDDLLPPAIPQKTRRRPHERQPSPYDNVPESSEFLVTCQMHQSHQSLSSSTSIASSISQDNSKPPPLPPKKKHMFQSVAYSVMAYMEMFGNCSHSNDQEFMRHSVHMVHDSAASWAPSAGLPTTQSCSFSHTSSSSSSRTTRTQMHTLSLPPQSGEDLCSPLKTPLSPMICSSLPPALPPKRSRSSRLSPPSTPQSLSSLPEPKTPSEPLPDLLVNTPKMPEDKEEEIAATENEVGAEEEEEEPEEEEEDDEEDEMDLMEELDVSRYLVHKKEDEDGPDIRGGQIDALIIHATRATKNGFSYQEAFLTTYRTFISPYELICKLIKRYNFFYCQPEKKARSRESFALIVRVVSDLTASDLDDKLQNKLIEFIQQLILGGELTLAKALRVKHIERHGVKEMAMKQTCVQLTTTLLCQNVTLLDFKSEQIAEQMTLLDADLFMKIEIPEVLIWAQEQNEERSPNLTKFTEHFNKMSYWARSKILLAEAKDREKFFLKFIKIMKHLRKINNFNSYLALLSALDSAPIRRLEWQKHVQEGLKEYCALIDSSSSFRAYRQALAETNPPCIPYIGLVLQDLTFVHIGNSNLLSENTINFSKRWQQFNIVENMKRFKKCLSNSSSTYSFKKNERIISFFENFDQFLSEDSMWQMSEKIKPRGGKKAAQ
ncbi:PREDICTED: guanine nucleotide-releasing factor 2 isoform X2 [Nicrophorus vespilloides]|uniref:Guanine nucleotide-releasing factor 2 isoform X2 n=1 Tax=Nicrophorus vespilloides TaxID=110193 RepID=A0ABM1MNR7_NICVS|nr:PREDICTED: guanine nucleotide-releasing factor 2 isoform X2 [Nicrophorus vespilloides]